MFGKYDGENSSVIRATIPSSGASDQPVPDAGDAVSKLE
jgi:hypothetical protein